MTTRPSMLGVSLTLCLFLGGLVGLLGCGDEQDEIGTPCSNDDECSGDLICDIHGDKGTCQDDHGHRVIPEGEVGPADVIVEG